MLMQMEHSKGFPSVIRGQLFVLMILIYLVKGKKFINSKHTVMFIFLFLFYIKSPIQQLSKHKC